MSTRQATQTYRCWNDCRQEGCPSHDITVLLQTTSDILIIDFNDKHISFDPSEWKALKKILQAWNYNQFDLKEIDV